jgi:hypothetical protein
MARQRRCPRPAKWIVRSNRGDGRCEWLVLAWRGGRFASGLRIRESRPPAGARCGRQAVNTRPPCGRTTRDGGPRLRRPPTNPPATPRRILPMPETPHSGRAIRRRARCQCAWTTDVSERGVRRLRRAHVPRSAVAGGTAARGRWVATRQPHRVPAGGRDSRHPKREVSAALRAQGTKAAAREVSGALCAQGRGLLDA